MIPLRDNIPSRRLPLVTIALIAACAVVFLFEENLDGDRLDGFIRLFGLVPARYTNPQWAEWAGYPSSYWPFLSHIFLHGGWLHFLGNMWFLWLFGDNVEDRLGRPRYLAFYLLCGLAAGLVQFFLTPSSRLPLVGASGAISGVMGAYFVLYPGARILTLVPIFIFIEFIQVPAFIFLGLWFILQLQSGALSLSASAGRTGGVAFWAHIGGFAAGFVLLRLMMPRTAPWIRRERAP